MWPDSLGLNVSRESLAGLEIYHALLLKWQKAINLVSPKTIDEAWVRHFADSVQVEQFVSRESQVLYDLGSGAGFPGAAIAILRPELAVHVIESDERKCQFLRTVSRETNIVLNIHVSRIESIALDLPAPDVVTARALADLSVLLEMILPWAALNPKLECVFMKGARADEEIGIARGTFDFDVVKRPSKTDNTASILLLKNISRK
jgi:16S rRNA (guanine527-N7)-methyltransferase